MKKLFPIFALSFLMGCGSDSKRVDAFVPGILEDPLQISSRLEAPCSTGAVMRVEEMTPNDVIVAVNGYPLTREVFDDQMKIKASFLMRRKEANPSVVSEQLDQYKWDFVNGFVTQRLLIDDARTKHGLTNDLRVVVSRYLKSMAKQSHRTIDQIIKSFPGDRKYMYYDIAERLLVDELIRRYIPPTVKVDSDFVSNVQQQVALQNEETVHSNAFLKAKMMEWKNDIVSGKISFDAAVAKYSEDFDQASTNQDRFIWGDFERNDLDDMNMRAVVFSMKVGDVSDVLEDDNGFHVVKYLSYLPQKTNAAGRIIRRASRRLQHIYREKEQQFLRQDDKAMFADLSKQVQMEAIGIYVDALKTNGLNRIEFPHGKMLFK